MVRIKKNKAEEFLSNVPEDKAFWVNDGKVLRNLHDLSSALADMNEETFKHHVNKDKNDFYNWVSDVIGDKNLSKNINRTKKKEIMLNRITRRVDQLTHILGKK